MTVKIMHPVALARHFSTSYHLEFEHAGELHQIEVARVDELEDALGAIAHAAGICVDSLFVTSPYTGERIAELVEETKQEFCNFHVEAALRLREVLGYSAGSFDLLLLLNAAAIRIKRHQKRLEELGEKLDEGKG